MSELQVGDVVIFSKQAIKEWEFNQSTWYEDYGMLLTDTFIVQRSALSGLSWIVKNTRNGHIFGLTKYKFTLAKEKEPYQDVIQKIKYLNKRYQDRKHVQPNL